MISYAVLGQVWVEGEEKLAAARSYCACQEGSRQEIAFEIWFPMRNLEKITLRWLGVAGIELGCPGRRIIFDPYFSRISFRKNFLFPNSFRTRTYPNATSPRRTRSSSPIPISTTLLDAAEAARQTGAVVYGSPNTCRILRAEGLPESQILELHPGSVVDRDGVKITALAERPHQWVAGFGMQAPQARS